MKGDVRIRKETARDFWRRCLKLVCNGAAPVYVENPAYGFTVNTKAGEYDGLSDGEYKALLGDHEELNAIWSKEQRRSAGDILLSALRMTAISEARMTGIVDALAESSACSSYLPGPGQRGCGPSLQEIHRACQASAPDGAPALDDWSPRAIYEYICRHVHGQDGAKRAAAMAVYNHVEGRRSNILFCGPSGCGKSEIWRCLARDYPKLIRLFDASRLSADGWKGSLHLRDIFEGIPAGDLRERGLIVVLDEADKICCEAAIGSGGTNYNALLQGNLLKMLDGDVIEFGPGDNGGKAFQVDCSRVSFMLLGAFESLLQNKSRTGIGFAPVPHAGCAHGGTDISYDDLVAAGMRREIAGRIGRIVPLRPLTAEDYRAILTGPVLDELQAARKCRIGLDGWSVEALAERAVSAGLGVRWMRSQVVNALDDLMFDDPAAEEYMIAVSPEAPAGGHAEPYAWKQRRA